MSRTITVRLDDELLRSLEAFAARRMVSRNAVIKAAIREFLQRRGVSLDNSIKVRVVWVG